MRIWYTNSWPVFCFLWSPLSKTNGPSPSGRGTKFDRAVILNDVGGRRMSNPLESACGLALFCPWFPSHGSMDQDLADAQELWPCWFAENPQLDHGAMFHQVATLLRMAQSQDVLGVDGSGRKKNTPILDIQSLFLWCLLVLIFLWAFWDEPSEEPRFSEALSQHAAPPKVTKIARLSLKLALSFVDRPASGFATGQNGGAWSCQHQKVDLWHPEDCYNDYISHLRPSPTFRKLVQLQKPLGPLGCSFLLERRIFARPLNPTWTDKTGTRKNF